MTTFLMTSAAMVLVALLLLAPALLKRSRQMREDTREDNVRIAREHLAELQKEHEQGELSDEEFAQAKHDLEIALAQDLSANEAQQTNDARGSVVLTLAILAVAIPMIVYAVYQETGSPQYLHLVGPGQPQQTASQHGGQNAPSMDELIAKMEERLKAQPDDPRGWFLLGRSYMKFDRYDDAVRAYREVVRLLPEDTTGLVSLVDATAMQNGGKITEEGQQLLQKILSVEPDHFTALWLSGNAAEQQGDDATALKHWARAYPLLEGEPQMQQQLSGMIAQVEQRSGLKAEIQKPKQLPNIMDAAPVAEAQPAPAPANTSQPVITGNGLVVQVALAPALLENAAPTDSVFIYAKAASGPPMPLAVSRHTVAELPIKVELNDSMAMMPQMKLSDFAQVLVGARVSKTGQAIPQPGDLQSTEIATANTNRETLSVLINLRRP